MSAIRVRLGERSYPIHIADSFATLPQRLEDAGFGDEVWVISHASLLARYGRQLLAPLRRAGITAHLLRVPESERTKSYAMAERVITQLARQAARRVPGLLAFGGGVVGDLAGFVAAVFRRGVPYAQIPTTLLAQVDSAIGGKVGVDVAFAKNLIGAFYQPRLVFDHLGVLRSLPLRQRRSGLSEVIKYGVMADPKLFRFLEIRMDECLALTPYASRVIVERCSRIKARVVSQDERETKGVRITLNFGHTIGHALETATGYARFTHGEAIAVGMACASELAVARGHWRASDHERVVRLLGNAGLPLSAPGLSLASVQRALAYDKKFVAGRLRWVLPTRLGRVVVDDAVPAELVWRTVRRYL